MRLISPTEKVFITDGISREIRADGRRTDQIRKLVIETDCIPHANGSAQVTVENGSNILVGIRLDLGMPDFQEPTEGKVICTVDCSASSRIDQYEYKSIRDVNAELAEAIHRILSSSIDKKSLCIIPGKSCWILYVDAVILDYGGNLMDPLMLAIQAAISATPIPKVVINRLSEDVNSKEYADFSLEIDESSLSYFELKNFPLCISIFIIESEKEQKKYYFLDATKIENLASSEKIHFFISRDGLISSLKNVGNGILSYSELMTVTAMAKCKIGLFFSLLDSITSVSMN